MLLFMAIESVDVIIVGAGLAGIGAARHLQDKCPDRSYLILEEREAMGGTWDLYRYPGIRSDLGSVSLPGHSLGQRHVHARLQLQAVEGRQGHCRRPVDPQIHPGNGGRNRR